MEILNTTLDKYCKMLYFWKGDPTSLGKLSNKDLESIVKFIKKYPEGLLNGYEKSVYLQAVNYILDWRNNKTNKALDVIESRYVKRAEEKANLLTAVIFKAMKQTEKQYDLV